jgi:hypothetical protein
VARRVLEEALRSAQEIGVKQARTQHRKDFEGVEGGEVGA